jgi:GNAT superfamily N-acetyltransferase
MHFVRGLCAPLERMKNVSRRIATADDVSFALNCETETMRPYAIATWGEWPEERVRVRAHENARAGRTEIIELDGEPIGILRVERNFASYDLKQIFLVPAYQRRGIGSALVDSLLEETKAASVPLRLRVLKVNPARNLYKRLGFRVVESTPEYEYLEHVF